MTVATTEMAVATTEVATGAVTRAVAAGKVAGRATPKVAVDSTAGMAAG